MVSSEASKASHSFRVRTFWMLGIRLLIDDYAGIRCEGIDDGCHVAGRIELERQHQGS